jgi:hypothetical protein
MVNTTDILPNTPRYLKAPLIFFNVILWLLGIILIALGGVALDRLKKIAGLENISIPAGLIVLGVFLLILTIVGCVVAYKEKLVGLILYTILILILLICLIGVGGGAFTYRKNATAPLAAAWPKQGAGVGSLMQQTFGCCGWDNDAEGNRTYVFHTPTQLDCVIQLVINGSDTIYLTKPNTDPCSPKIVKFVEDNLYLAGVAGVVIGVIEFICFLFALFLIIRLCRSPRSRSYD